MVPTSESGHHDTIQYEIGLRIVDVNESRQTQQQQTLKQKTLRDHTI
jgi:hypothetical protein